ncbi:carboxymuconolactone decarboxylase family protein [Acidobacteria bacterium AH-259-D05]|nr:carboxymuconolactone decarboxylase family protein [Acidobacteria bacterium AH-259-D05]
MPRYLPVQLDAANEDIKRVYSEMEQDIGFVPNFIKTLAHSGNFLEGVADLYRGLMGETSLSEKLRQLVILKTCKVDKCKYTVTCYAELAKKEGWTDEQIQAMDDYASSDLFNYYEKEVLRLAELVSLEPDEIPADYWMQLDNHFTSDQVVELITLIGFFNMINRFILALQIEPDPSLAEQKG